MKYFNIKSIILGIGIGFVLTAISGSVYFSFVDKKVPMTKEDIITEAKKYGLIEPSSVLKQSDSKNTAPAPASETSNSSQTPVPTQTPKLEVTPTLGPQVDIMVEAGDTAVKVAKKLYDNKLIDNQDIFIKQMIESGAAYKMIAKQYYLRVGMSMDDIIKTLITKAY